MRSLRNSIASVSEVSKSLHGYESLKSNLMEFPSLDLSKTRTSSLDPAVKSLRLKVTEMETILKISRERVRLLERTVEDLSLQLEKLQSVNKALLSDKLDLNSSDIHYFVQDVLLTDVKKQLDDAHGDIEKYRLDTERAKKKCESVVQENKRVEGMIKRYRKIVSEINTKAPFPDNSSINDVDSLLPSIKKTWSDKQKPKNPEKTRIKFLQIIEQGVKEMSESGNLKQIFSAFCNSIRALTGCSKLSLYIVSPMVQQVYVQLFPSLQHVQRVLLGTTWVQLHTDPSCDVVDPSFSRLEEAILGVRTSDKLIHCVYLQKDPSLIIQCLNPAKAFEPNDEKMISILIHHLAICTKHVLSSKREKGLKDQLVDIVSVSAEISRSRSHQALANTIDVMLPKFFECETAGVVFVNEPSKELYTLAYSSETDLKYSQDVIRFPISMGLTGETYKHRGQVLYENVKKKHLYNPEVDNIASASDLNTCLMSCMPGPNNSICGVLQLGNKPGGFSQRETQIVTAISTIMGFMIAGINDISAAMDLTIKMKQHLSVLSVGLGADIADLSPDSSSIMDQMEIIKSVVYTWSKNKKIKLKDLS